MGRSKFYKSPSTLKRSKARLVIFLHRRITALQVASGHEKSHTICTIPERLYEENNGTLSNPGSNEDRPQRNHFFNSTPECWDKCFEKLLFK